MHIRLTGPCCLCRDRMPNSFHLLALKVKYRAMCSKEVLKDSATIQITMCDEIVLSMMPPDC